MTPEVLIVSWFKLQQSSGCSVSIWISQVMREKIKARLFSPLLSKKTGKFIPVG